VLGWAIILNGHKYFSESFFKGLAVLMFPVQT
jgi:hypothetical protein